MIRIESAETLEFVATIRRLFVEYSESLEVDLCFQGFAEELAKLPGDYARPAGRLTLAFQGNEVAGCGGLRPLGSDVCEMKRLYVRPAFRGKGAGGAMIDALIRSAREIGYQRMLLDTLPSMANAIAIDRSLGFREIAPYRANPVPGALFFGLDLAKLD
ncbi:MAG TPA: GNAT family N-acetyltransferase [Candidatus Acidoferrales bacterium]